MINMIKEAIDNIPAPLKGVGAGDEEDHETKAKVFCFRRGYACGMSSLAFQAGTITLEEYEGFQDQIDCSRMF